MKQSNPHTVTLKTEHIFVYNIILWKILTENNIPHIDIHVPVIPDTQLPMSYAYIQKQYNFYSINIGSSLECKHLTQPPSHRNGSYKSCVVFSLQCTSFVGVHMEGLMHEHTLGIPWEGTMDTVQLGSSYRREEAKVKVWKELNSLRVYTHIPGNIIARMWKWLIIEWQEIPIPLHSFYAVVEKGRHIFQHIRPFLSTNFSLHDIG